MNQIRNKWKFIEIHTWGGLGSQLHALMLFVHLSHLHKKRNFRIVFHSSGVTRRHPEILDFLTKSQFTFIDDFNSNNDSKIRDAHLLYSFNSKNNVNSRSRRLIRFILTVSGFLISGDSFEVPQLRFLTRQIRGHYSKIRFPYSTYETLASLVGISRTEMNQYEISAHIRLGDLITLKTKEILPVDRFLKMVITEFHRNIYTNLNLFTESVDLVNQSLKYIVDLRAINVYGPEISALQVITSCTKSTVFYGTSSKLTLWIAIFRCLNGINSTFLPLGLRNNFESFAPENMWKMIDYYEI